MWLSTSCMNHHYHYHHHHLQKKLCNSYGIHGHMQIIDILQKAFYHIDHIGVTLSTHPSLILMLEYDDHTTQKDSVNRHHRYLCRKVFSRKITLFFKSQCRFHNLAKSCLPNDVEHSFDCSTISASCVRDTLS
jgi:hypothetical protein